MTQKALPINSQRYSRKVVSGVEGVVAVDRSEGDELVLRFVSTSEGWADPACEVKIDLDLAQKLVRLLAEELQTVAYQF